MKRPASRGDAERSGTPRRRGLGRGRKWVPRDQPASSEPPPSPRRSAPGARDHDTHRWDTHYGDTHYGDTHHWQPSDPPDPPTEPIRPEPRPEGPPPPRKITVTRVAAWRSRQLVGGGMRRFHQATTADGAGRSGLSSLTYASMMDYAASAAIAVALANTLFFAAASTTASRAHVALYLLITVAPFAVVA
ncbi:MAG TPA: MFS transporter, partial [Pseudonocardiaceae bacterium]|nr:MFS transporter [Pseudonocardiaceae bacterium]